MPVTRIGAVHGAIHHGCSYAEYLNGRGPLERGILGAIAAAAGMTTPLPLPTDPGELDPDHDARVCLYRDQWIAQCPFCGQDFQLVWPDEPYFLCAGCWNEHVGGRYVRAPMPHRWQEVDQYASLVTRRVHRNWLPPGEYLGLLAGSPTMEADEVITAFKGLAIAGETVEELEARLGLPTP